VYPLNLELASLLHVVPAGSQQAVCVFEERSRHVLYLQGVKGHTRPANRYRTTLLFLSPLEAAIRGPFLFV